MKSFKTAIIAGALALVAVIATVIVLTSGSSGYGLYISSVSGDVVISNAEGTTQAAAETFLATGDALTVNAGGSCTLIYRTRDNYDQNYIVLEPATQVLATGKYTGKSDDELYLNRGSVMVSALNKSKKNIIIRTASASVTTKDAAMRIAYELGDGTTTTLAASFGGASEIQLYDALGNAVDRDGIKLQSPEVLGEGLSAKVVSSGDVPSFEYLNIKTDLSAYNADTLKELLTISAFHDGMLSFTAAEIKAAYDAAPTEAPADEPEVPEESVTEETTVTTVPEISETEETTIPSEETTVTTTTPAQTTTAYTTTTAATTQAPQTTVQTTSTASGKMITVYVIIDDEITMQEVPYGGNATQPADPVVEGKKFVGWDGSFTNITEETTISAIFEDDASVTTASTSVTFDTTETTTSDSRMFTVTVVVNGNATTQQVAYGGSAVLPAVNIPGYVFMGWDRSPDNITENCTITAILVPDGSTTDTSATTYTVTFVVDGVSYPVTVSAGSSAVAPVSPTINSRGQTFIGWDTDFSNVTHDLTVTALFL
ncbi:Internalin-A precursor [uncultured Ruminococcus sp.]|uniref:InlB B-repeat-containing protein n=1 Tax=Huintestinicola butyrica TaxID=2981728 RepID=UPI0008227CD8|nr:InlB B-repeat-containing protein [Huintestinicola butyrica]MCU6726897.1 InlB B-repeat-containing protein [Huintestinicola butyrica]SCI64259.1 Internalin-A precursor [uncultured Ruminococcus sp.]